MSFESLLATGQKLNSSLETLAAIGALLRARRDGLTLPPDVERLLGDIARHTDESAEGGLPAAQEAIVLGFITAFFRQALDLLENPDRPTAWQVTDEAVMQAFGRASRVVVGGIEGLAAKRPDVAEVLTRKGRFLDIGSGTGWLAIEAAQSWPDYHVVGIDPWEPAMALARRNVAESPARARVELRLDSVETLADRETYDLAWFAGPFIPKQVVETSLPKVRASLKPGGILVFGLFAPAPSPIGQNLADLRIVRSGGHPWTTREIGDSLKASGFEAIEPHDTGTPALFVVARRPA